MGAGESTATQNDGTNDMEQEDAASAISVTYGPNIVGQLLGYDERTETLSLAAEQLYDAISRPSKSNTKKAQILVNEVHSTGMEHGRETVNLAEIEKDMMDDIMYKTYLHKQTYGVQDKSDVDKKFNLDNMNSVCNEFRTAITDCLQNNKTNTNGSSMPYYDQAFSSLNCAKEMDAYNNCVSGRLSGLY